MCLYVSILRSIELSKTKDPANIGPWENMKESCVRCGPYCWRAGQAKSHEASQGKAGINIKASRGKIAWLAKCFLGITGNPAGNVHTLAHACSHVWRLLHTLSHGKEMFSSTSRNCCCFRFGLSSLVTATIAVCLLNGEHLQSWHYLGLWSCYSRQACTDWRVMNLVYASIPLYLVLAEYKALAEHWRFKQTTP